MAQRTTRSESAVAAAEALHQARPDVYSVPRLEPLSMSASLNARLALTNPNTTNTNTNTTNTTNTTTRPIPAYVSKANAVAFQAFGVLARSLYEAAHRRRGSVVSAARSFLGGESVFSRTCEAPALVLDEFLRRCHKYDKCGAHELVLALIYLQRLQRHLTSRKLDKYVVAAVLVASKTLQDTPYDNRAFAAVAGLPVACLNRIERRFLFRIGFCAVPTDAEWLAAWDAMEQAAFAPR